MNRENWFLVLPTIVLGVVALLTLHHLHAAGDVRRAVETVSIYRAGERPPLGEYLAAGADRLDWQAKVVSRFYGTLDVSCRLTRRGGEPVEYRWRVDVLQGAFAPADETTRELMRQYEPALYSRLHEGAIDEGRR
ncbi:MAG: hypothetical protein ACE5HV_06525 [Acidobacteriota bacterium]